MQKYMQMQQIDQQIKQAQKQLMMLDEQLQDLNITEQALKDVQNTKSGTIILSPVSNGIFIQSELKDNKDVMINVGAGVVVKKSIPDAQKLIQKQTEEVKKIHEEMLSNVQNLIKQTELLQKEIK